MGQREAGVNLGPGQRSELPASPRAAARQLDGEIAALREELGSLVGELDRRRHEALDVKLQLRRHAREVIVSGSALVAAVSGLVWLMSGRHRSMVSPPKVSLVGKVVEGLSRIPRRTARAAAEPHTSTKIVTVAAPAEVTTAAVAITVKKLLQLGLQRWWERNAQRGPLPLRPRAFKRLPAPMKHSDPGDRA